MKFVVLTLSEVAQHVVYRSMKKYPYGQGKTITCYLIHFTRPVAHASHYIGQTDRPVEERLAEHRAGRGARLCRQAVRAGAELLLVRVWEDVPRCFEQKLKNRGGAKRLCPVCMAEKERISRGRNRRGLIVAEKSADPGSPGEDLTAPRNALVCT